jgi:steroid 5-alpha reductase family enzyme
VSWGALLVNLVVTAGVVAVLMLATFVYAMRTRVHAIMDTVWPLGFVIIAVVSFGLSSGHGSVGRRVLVLVLTAVWGLRLGGHIFARNRGQGEDRRYASLLRRNTGSLATFVLRYIYWAQGRFMWFVSLPVQVAMYEHASLSSLSWLSWLSWLGVFVWAVGFGFEAVGDWQLRRFLASGGHAGQVLDQGAAYADYVRRTSGFIPWPPR